MEHMTKKYKHEKMSLTGDNKIQETKQREPRKEINGGATQWTVGVVTHMENALLCLMSR